MLTMPSVPNPADGFPVAASRAKRRVPPRNITRAEAVPSPGQYPTPRCDATATGGPPPRRPPADGVSPGGGAAAATPAPVSDAQAPAAAAAGTVYDQISLPLSASSATTCG